MYEITAGFLFIPVQSFLLISYTTMTTKFSDVRAEFMTLFQLLCVNKWKPNSPRVLLLQCLRSQGCSSKNEGLKFNVCVGMRKYSHSEFLRETFFHPSRLGYPALFDGMKWRCERDKIRDRTVATVKQTKRVNMYAYTNLRVSPSQ